MLERRFSHEIKIGNVIIGRNNPIAIQSMTNTDAFDKEGTFAQIKALEDAGCDIVRLAVPKAEASDIFSYLKHRGVKIPLVADIHFDYKIALECIKNGVDKVRINPGNIGSRERVAEVARACEAAGIPIRIGVNGGSLEKHILEKYKAPTAQALAESALYHAEILESVGFSNIAISVKSSSVTEMIEANRILAEKTSYPLHLGVTEAGGEHSGTVKSAIGIGTLLSEGIGDTIRVSLTADPVKEIYAAKQILLALGIYKRRELEIISCPTCGRTKIDLIPLLEKFEEEIDRRCLRQKPLKVAFMGCAVNGPGEAREADIGIAGGINEALMFSRGEIIGKVAGDNIVSVLADAIEKM